MAYLRPDRGTLAVLGGAPEAARGLVGYAPEQPRYHALFSAREYLLALGACDGLPRAEREARCEEVLALVDLGADADRRLGRYSKGMLQRLGIAQALLRRPRLLLLDEPTAGLDPAGQRDVLALVAGLRRQGQSLLLCSHHLAEVEALCDRVGILSDGRLAAEARPADLAAGRAIITTASPVPELVADALRALGSGVTVDGRQVDLPQGEATTQAALRLLLDAGIFVQSLRPRQGGLADLYLRAIHGLSEACLGARRG